MTLLKIIAVCLALANTGYFLWTHGIARTAQAPAEPSAAESLQLASESPAAARLPVTVPGGAGGEIPRSGAEGMAGSAFSTGNALSTAAKRCISVGPFRDVFEAAHAATTLRGGGYDPRQRVAEGEIWAGFWVYLPLPAAQAAGDHMLAKLKAAGIEDGLEMPGPGDGSVISLGLYNESKRAQARVAQAHALGFNPGMAERKRTGNVYWIDIDLKPSDSLFNPADLQGEAGRIVRLEVKGCPTASGVSQ